MLSRVTIAIAGVMSGALVYILMLYPDDARTAIRDVVTKVFGVPPLDVGYYVVLYALILGFITFVGLGIFEIVRALKRRRQKKFQASIGRF